MPDLSANYAASSTFIGFDYSQNKIGVAVGQRLTATASGLTTVVNPKKTINWADIDAIIQQWRPAALIVGLPLTLDGEEQETTLMAKQFGAQLETHYNLPVHYMDERLTSREASQLLGYDGITAPRRTSRPGKKLKKNKRQGHDIDQLAAQLILQSWLNDNG